MVASGSAMVDSGAGKHLTSKKRCTAKELENATHTNVILLTAKGEEHVDKEVEMYLDSLGVSVPALALDDCPNAVSLGRLVVEHGFTFKWTRKTPPVLVSPLGVKTILNVKGFVPYLPAGGLRGSKGNNGKAADKHEDSSATPAIEGGSSSSASGQHPGTVTGEAAADPVTGPVVETPPPPHAPSGGSASDLVVDAPVPPPPAIIEDRVS